MAGFAFRQSLRAYGPQLRFCLRTTVAGLVAFAIAKNFTFPLHGLWTVLTAVVVTQVSVGGSLRATVEYVVGTLAGAVYAAAVGVAIPHPTALLQGLVLALAIAPLAFASAISPRFRVAPFSAVLVLLIGSELGQSPIASAITRVLEVALGGAVGMVVSLVVFPQRAHSLGAAAAVKTLGQLADLLPKLLAGAAQKFDAAEVARKQGELGASVAAFQALALEAERERIVPFAPGADPAALSRTLLRLRHDLVILGRATASPLPQAIAQRLGPPIDRFGAEASEFLRGSASALASAHEPPPLAATEKTLKAYEAEVAALRAEGLIRGLSTAEVEGIFALGFALDQLGRDLADLAQRIQEYGDGGRGGRPA
jgi:uncharacterized membrane protein YccC